MAFAKPPGPAPTMQTFFLFAGILAIARPVTSREQLTSANYAEVLGVVQYESGTSGIVDHQRSNWQGSRFRFELGKNSHDLITTEFAA